MDHSPSAQCYRREQEPLYSRAHTHMRKLYTAHTLWSADASPAPILQPMHAGAHNATLCKLHITHALCPFDASPTHPITQVRLKHLPYLLLGVYKLCPIDIPSAGLLGEFVIEDRSNATITLLVSGGIVI